MIYGSKRWAMYPPHHMIMSNKQILEYFETDFHEFERRNVHATSCVQHAGDVMIIPENWGHGVLNLEDSIAMASELRKGHWRLSPGPSSIGKLPFDNRNV